MQKADYVFDWAQKPAYRYLIVKKRLLVFYHLFHCFGSFPSHKMIIITFSTWKGL